MLHVDAWKLVDFFNHALMVDPVIAEDGYTYSRHTIEEFFEWRRAQGLPIVSPRTRRAMGRRLKENLSKAEAVCRYRKTVVGEHLSGAGTGEQASIHMLGRIFAHLDPLRSFLALNLDGWAPPQVVVIGQESSGKSTLLERLAMMPIFPRDENFCTKCAVHVRLRRGEPRTPRLEVLRADSLERVAGPLLVPAEAGSREVQAQMESLAGECGVATDHIIVLHVQNENVPSIDLVDMPGIRADKAMQAKTKEVVRRHVDRYGAQSLYLLVVPANERPTNSMACEIIEELGLESQTLGVFTKCDAIAGDFAIHKKSRQALKQLVRQSPSADAASGFPLRPHGWVATMNAPVDQIAGEARPTNFRKLQEQVAQEQQFFETLGMEDLALSGHATSNALVGRLNDMFLDCMRREWVPLTIEKLKDLLDARRFENVKLGMPFIPPSEVKFQETMHVASVAELRDRSASAMSSLLEAEFPRMMQRYASQVLMPLKEQLEGIITSQLQGSLGSLPTWRDEEIPRVLAACREHAERGTQFWRGALQEAIAAGAELPGWPSWKARDLLFDLLCGRAAPPFQPQRFPAFAEAVVRRWQGSMEAQRPKLLQSVDRLAQSFYGAEGEGMGMSPWLRLRSNLEGPDCTVAVECDRAPFIEHVLLAFVQAPRSALSTVLSELPAAAGEVKDWTEACAAQRAHLAEEISQLEQASDGILGLVGTEAAEDVQRRVRQLRSERWSALGRSETSSEVPSRSERSVIVPTGSEEGDVVVWERCSVTSASSGSEAGDAPARERRAERPPQEEEAPRPLLVERQVEQLRSAVDAQGKQLEERAGALQRVRLEVKKQTAQLEARLAACEGGAKVSPWRRDTELATSSTPSRQDVDELEAKLRKEIEQMRMQLRWEMQMGSCMEGLAMCSIQ